MIARNRIALVASLVAAATLVAGQGGGKVKFNEFTIKKTTGNASYGGAHVLYQDIFIPANANSVIVAAGPGGGPHVKVFSGQLSRPGVGILKSQDGGKTWSGQTKSIDILLLEPPTSPTASQNNLKQMSLASINFSDTRITLLTHMADGSVREARTVRLKGVKARAGSKGTLTLSFTGLEAVPTIQSSGVWFLKNSNSPG